MGSRLIEVYDASIRESAQGVGVNFSLPAMIAMIGELDRLGGISVLEAGWPGASRKWDALFAAIRSGEVKKPKNVEFAAFGSTRRARKTVESDALFQQLLTSPVSIVTVFGKTWTAHVTDALQTSLENNLRMVEESMAAICQAGKRAVFDAEHFFQGFQHDEAYALSVLEAALRGGADTLALCDTNGVAYPWDVAAVVSRVVEEFGQDAVVGVHLHGDRGHENTNTLVALQAGALHFQGTVNGYSERVRMADTLTVLANLHLLVSEGRADWAQISKPFNPDFVRRVSREMDHWIGLHPDPRKPFTGRFTASHKGGAHVSAIMRGKPELYESYPPEMFGGRRHIVLSSMSGRANVVAFTKTSWGIDLDGQAAVISSILEQIEECEEGGYCVDSCSGSAARIVARILWPEAPCYTPALEEEKPYVWVDLPGLQPGEVAVIVKLPDGSYSSPGTGDGPVDALYQALFQVLANEHSCLNGLELEDYRPFQLRLPGLESTKSAMRVEIEWQHEKYGSFVTQGVSTNLIHASWQAICEAIELVLIRQWRQSQPETE